MAKTRSGGRLAPLQDRKPAARGTGKRVHKSNVNKAMAGATPIHHPSATGPRPSAGPRGKLAAKLDNNNGTDDDVGGQVEISSFVQHRVDMSTHSVDILVDWKDGDQTWEPEMDLQQQAPELLYEYWAGREGGRDGATQLTMFHVFQVLRKKKGKCLVQWVGYPPSQATLEPNSLVKKIAPETFGEGFKKDVDVGEEGGKMDVNVGEAREGGKMDSKMEEAQMSSNNGKGVEMDSNMGEAREGVKMGKAVQMDSNMGEDQQVEAREGRSEEKPPFGQTTKLSRRIIARRNLRPHCNYSNTVVRMQEVNQ